MKSLASMSIIYLVSAEIGMSREKYLGTVREGMIMRLGIENEKLVMRLYNMIIGIKYMNNERAAMVCDALTNPDDTSDESAFNDMIEWLSSHKEATAQDVFRAACGIGNEHFPEEGIEYE